MLKPHFQKKITWVAIFLQEILFWPYYAQFDIDGL